METLKYAFEVESYLKFTLLANERKLTFLDVSVKRINNIFSTSFHVKEAKKELNGLGECCERFNRSALNSYFS